MHSTALLLASLSTVFSLGCDAPGKGPKAERGYERAKPVVAALEAFRTATRQYPDSLSELVPRFLDASALELPSGVQEHYPFEYHRAESNFKLSFRYVGPGMNQCTIEGTHRTWECSGHY